MRNDIFSPRNAYHFTPKQIMLEILSGHIYSWADLIGITNSNLPKGMKKITTQVSEVQITRKSGEYQPI